jgi:hypothetical protein
MRRRDSSVHRRLVANDGHLIIEEDRAEWSVAQNTAVDISLLDRTFDS